MVKVPRRSSLYVGDCRDVIPRLGTFHLDSASQAFADSMHASDGIKRSIVDGTLIESFLNASGEPRLWELVKRYFMT